MRTLRILPACAVLLSGACSTLATGPGMDELVKRGLIVDGRQTTTGEPLQPTYLTGLSYGSGCSRSGAEDSTAL
jgi:hypothetical protein